MLVPEIIFQKSGIFDGVKLISDIQRHSIKYSKPNFECQIASCIFKKNWATAINFRPEVSPLNFLGSPELVGAV